MPGIDALLRRLQLLPTSTIQLVSPIRKAAEEERTEERLRQIEGRGREREIKGERERQLPLAGYLATTTVGIRCSIGSNEMQIHLSGPVACSISTATSVGVVLCSCAELWNELCADSINRRACE